MTVWMHKGGDILLRYSQQYHIGWYDFTDGTNKYQTARKEFFRQHCVYIGRF